MTEALHLHSRLLSRRSFLITVGSTSIAVAFGGLNDKAFGATIAGASNGDYKPNAWVAIAGDGIVSIISPASEMGQGIMTALPLLIAEDMDADWNKVRIVQAPSDAKNYGNPAFQGLQVTGGSLSIRGYYDMMRLVGAQTRKVILASGARMLKAPVNELTTEPNKVLHLKSGRSLGYGEIAATGVLPNPLPQATTADLKPAAQWRYIGKTNVPRIDVPAKVDGTAKFGIDVQLPDMLFGAVLRAPVQGEKPETVDDTAAKAVAGIKKIILLPYGVGIIGETFEATRTARGLLRVTWSNSSKQRSYTSGEVLDEFRGIGRDLARAGVTVHTKGDAPTAIKGAIKVIEVDYMSDHVYHATMEPLNATALVTGDTVEVWAPTQGPSFTQNFAAMAAGTTPDKVKLHVTLIGGGFGRKGEADFVVDAVLLAKEVQGRPVKVMWSRGDDVKHGKYRPLQAQHVQVGLDADGKIVGWRHRIVADSIYARTFTALFESEGGRDDVVTEGLKFNYHVPAHLVEYIRQDKGQDVGFWRSIATGYTNFGVECVIDEIAAARGIDPLALRQELLKGEPRALKVLATVAEMAQWDRRRDGRALGLAYSDAFGAHCAQIAEVSLNRESGEIRVHTVWCAVDAGVAIQPLNIEAQIIGGITHGASHALFEQINFINGEVQETNFDTYRVMRMSETPEIHVTVIPTPENRPGGVGEVGLPPTGPAIANAVARLTGGVRLRHFPFLPDRVKEALGA